MSQWIGIPEASKRMGVKERQARNRLVAMQARHPHRELLRSHNKPGTVARKYQVNVAALEELVRIEQESDLDEHDERIGSLESYERIIRKRLARLEKAVFGIDTAEKIRDLESRLRQLSAIVGSDNPHL